MNREASDADLIARVRVDGDTGAFGELVARYRLRVYRYLAGLSRDRQLADDLAQDTFVHAWNKLGSFRGEGSFEGWLLRVAYTIFLQSYRRSSRHKVLSLDADETPEQAHAASRSDGSEGATLDLERLLAVVEPEIRTMLILTYAFGYTASEVARVVDMPAGTVKSHISRGKSRIRAVYGDGESA